jgi:formylglycine-generating enzyme required for sulfatase activity
MPKCISCNEVYADQLRRCPHCGYSAEPAPPEPRARFGAGLPRIPKRVARYAAIAAVAAAAALGVVICWPSALTQPSDDLPPRRSHGGAEDESELVTLPKPQEIVADPVETRFEVAEARLEGAQFVVTGSCSERAIVEIRVNGRRATIQRDGNRFFARVPAAGDSVEVVAFGIRGDRATLKKEVVRVEEDDAELLRLQSHADGATLHTAKAHVACAPWTGSGAERTVEVPLANVENRFTVGRSCFVLYRAPEDVTYLRTTANGVLTFLREIDDQEMVLVNGGVSWRGMGHTEPSGPRHLVELDPFLIDRTEVTCGQYARFLSAAHRGVNIRTHPEDPGVNLRPAGWTSDEAPEGMHSLPVTGIPWYAAWAYARWADGRLPTETEWERAAAGPLGRAYPWGDEFDATRCCAGAAGPMAVDSLVEGAGFFDLLHATGNVREWCLDRFDPRWYMRGGRKNPRGPASNTHRVVRGGSYASPAEALRLQHRDHVEATKRSSDVGFRVVRPWEGFADAD